MCDTWGVIEAGSELLVGQYDGQDSWWQEKWEWQSITDAGADIEKSVQRDHGDYSQRYRGNGHIESRYG